MRLILLLSLLFINVVAFGKIQPDSANLRTSIVALNDALIKKDSVTLGKVLHKKLSYGHSNGWIENKKDVIANLYNGKLTYNKIEQSKVQVEIVRETATVRSTTNIDVLLDGKPLVMTLHVLQVWVWKDKEGWKLLGRQSLKV